MFNRVLNKPTELFSYLFITFIILRGAIDRTYTPLQTSNIVTAWKNVHAQGVIVMY